jgi:hypothetical protein
MKLKQLEKLLTEYVAEKQPNLADQLSLSLALKQMEQCREGLVMEFVNWLIEKEKQQTSVQT